MYPTDRKWLRSPIERVGTLAVGDLPPPAERAGDEEQLLLRGLRAQDEEAFASLLARYSHSMLRLARGYVRSAEDAEDVVQDTWLAVLTGVRRFEGRSSLKTWIFRILVNRARTRATRAARLVPFSSFTIPNAAQRSDGGLATADLLLRNADDGALTHGSRPWEPRSPADDVLMGELDARIRSAVDALPSRQREVITLRDLEGWTSAEVCALLDLSEANQRVLLHRARARVRARLEGYLSPQATWS